MDHTVFHKAGFAQAELCSYLEGGCWVGWTRSWVKRPAVQPAALGLVAGGI